MKCHYKHAGGSDSFIDYYANPPYFGTPTATIHVQTLDGKTSGESVAAMFSAAPDLLAACQDLVNHYRNVNTQGVPEVWPLFDAARTAIAKATGT